MNKILTSALIAANILVIAGIARADGNTPDPSTPAHVVVTYTAPKVAKVEPIKMIHWNMVQVCDASLTHCVVRALGGKVDGMAHGTLR